VYDLDPMIFQRLKKHLFQKHLQKELEIYFELPRNLTEDPIQKIAVLVDEVQLLTSSIQMDLEEKLHVSSLDIEVLVFCPFDKKRTYLENEITKKDFGWSGSLKLNKLKEFVKSDCDLLINYGLEENLYWKVITLRSQSKFKIGFSSNDNRLYDLSVSDSKRNTTVLTREAEKYLKILKKI